MGFVGHSPRARSSLCQSLHEGIVEHFKSHEHIPLPHWAVIQRDVSIKAPKVDIGILHVLFHYLCLTSFVRLASMRCSFSSDRSRQPRLTMYLSFSFSWWGPTLRLLYRPKARVSVFFTTCGNQRHPRGSVHSHASYTSPDQRVTICWPLSNSLRTKETQTSLGILTFPPLIILAGSPVKRFDNMKCGGNREF